MQENCRLRRFTRDDPVPVQMQDAHLVQFGENCLTEPDDHAYSPSVFIKSVDLSISTVPTTSNGKKSEEKDIVSLLGPLIHPCSPNEVALNIPVLVSLFYNHCRVRPTPQESSFWMLYPIWCSMACRSCPPQAAKNSYRDKPALFQRTGFHRGPSSRRNNGSAA